MKHKTAKALHDWQADELRRELCAAGTPPPVPAGWFTMRELASKLNTSISTATRLATLNTAAGKMEQATHPVATAGGRAYPTPIYRLK